ncbi:MAG: tripartite tricarboxylate transporter substrate binding protein [Burkholderiales bacterium]|nr:tripartite tricarboxylate transporter substrate binding protein [Burkholderiales bacterium]
MQLSFAMFPSRACIGLIAAVPLFVAALPAAAQSYPSRPVRMIVPYPAGGTTDVLTRRAAEALRARLGGSFVVENRPGAQTQLGVQELLRAPADGHALLMATASTMSLNPVLIPTLTYRVDEMAPVALIAKVPFAIDAALNFPPNRIAELISFARVNPGKVTVGTTGVGTSGHLVVEMFAAAAGIRALPVHYKGGAPAIQDILGGHVNLYFDGATSSVAHHRNKRLKILGVTSEKRMAALPDVPSVAEAGLPASVTYSWYGLVARAGTPDAIVARVHQVIMEYLAGPEVQEQLKNDAALPGDLSPAQFGRMIAEETAVYRRIVAPLNIKLE